MRIVTSQLTAIVLMLVCGSCAAQDASSAENDKNVGPTVHLEAHKGQTEFRIDDPVVVDLVFTSRTPGYVVNTNPFRILPIPEIVEVMPDGGWVRTHIAIQGEGLDGSALAT